MTFHQNNQEILLHTIKALRDIQDKMNEMVVTFKKLQIVPTASTEASFRNEIKDTQNEIDELKEELSDSNFPPDLEQPKILDLKDALREELLRKKRFLTSFDFDLKNTPHIKPTQKKLDESLKLDIQSAILVLSDELQKSLFSKNQSITESILKFKNKLEHRMQYPQSKTLIKKKENLEELNLNEFSNRFLKEVTTELEKIGVDAPFLKEHMLQKSIKESDQLDVDERNILWVPYPELKQIAHSALVKIQDLESYIPKAKRSTPPTSQTRILESLLKEIKKKIHSNHVLIATIDESLNAAKEKKKNKDYAFDFTIEIHITNLKQAIHGHNEKLEAFAEEIISWMDAN